MVPGLSREYKILVFEDVSVPEFRGSEVLKSFKNRGTSEPDLENLGTPELRNPGTDSGRTIIRPLGTNAP
jgi:hypothetical protein